MQELPMQTALANFLKIVMDYHDDVTAANRLFEERLESMEYELAAVLEITAKIRAAQE